MQVKPYLLPVLQFALVGPAVGVLIAVASAIGAHDAGGRIGWFAFLGYAVGTLPAVLAGVVYVLAWPARTLARALTVREFGVLLGALSGLAAFAMIRMFHGASIVPKDWLTLVMHVAAGAVCGGLAAPTRDATYEWVTVELDAQVQDTDT